MNDLTTSLFRQTLLSGRVYLQGLFALWVALGWGLLLFSGYTWIGLFFGLAAAVGGGIFGGYPVYSGTEEFMMALPPTRRQQYRIRFWSGLIPLLGLCLISLAMYWWNLPQRCWGLLFSSGYTDFYPEQRISAFWPLCLSLPMALYVCTFVGASLCQRPAQVGAAMLGGLVLVGLVTGLGLFLEQYAPDPRYQGGISVGLSLLLAAGVSLIGDHAYPRKEAAMGEGFQNGAKGMGVGLLVFLIAAFLLFLGLFSVKI